MSSAVTKSKDSQWLQLEVCREFQKNSCPRTRDSCKFAHPEPHVELSNGNKVMACYDSCKGRCTREVYRCKYYHPSPVLMEQLMLKGRNHLAMKKPCVQQISMLPQMFIQVPEVANLMVASETELALSAHKTESLAAKRPAEVPLESFYPTLFCKRAAMETAIKYSYTPYPPLFEFPTPAEPSTVIPLNASFVNYTDLNGQLLDNLPVCQDFNRNMCSRLNCKFVHLLDPKKLEINEQRVAVCRDHANSICQRQKCKYYHIPIQLPSAVEMASSGLKNLAQ